MPTSGTITIRDRPASDHGRAIAATGSRISTAIGYLHPARHRLNLTIRPFSNIHRVLVEGGRATGVDVECGGVVQTIRSRRVTLSAGAINSPAILMRSGIGPRSELEALGIKSVVDLPGCRPQPHRSRPVAVVANPRPGVPHDPRVTNPVGIRYTASGSKEFNDMQMYVVTYFDKSALIGSSIDLPFPCVAVVPGLQRPRSRGRVSLRSADPDVPAVIDLNYVGDPEDMRRMVDGVRIAWRLMNSARFAPYVKEFVNITREVVESDSAAAEFVLNNLRHDLHPVSTAKMGPDSDKEAVVDQYCRVRGVDGLRVVDASVMPNIVRANTNLTCIMFGERVADWMRAAA